MRIIIEIEGGQTGQPDIVLRSSSSGQTAADVTSARLPGASGGTGIDAGPAPTGDSITQVSGAVVTPSASISNAAGASSAGAAPSPDAGG